MANIHESESDLTPEKVKSILGTNDTEKALQQAREGRDTIKKVRRDPVEARKFFKAPPPPKEGIFIDARTRFGSPQPRKRLLLRLLPIFKKETN